MITWTNDTVKLKDLKPWERNPRRMRKGNAQRLLDSWRDYGQVQLIVVGPDNEVYDGHQRLSALKAVYGDDYEVEVRRASRPLTDEERSRLVFLLHAGAVGVWDWAKVGEWDADKLRDWGFNWDVASLWKSDSHALSSLLEGFASDESENNPLFDLSDKLLDKWQVKQGDLWLLGEHRIFCGDATCRDDMDKLMGGDKADMVWTDPPYGVGVSDKNKRLNSLDGRASARVTSPLENDSLDRGEMEQFLLKVFGLASEYCVPGASWYVCSPGVDKLDPFLRALNIQGIFKQTIVWVKNAATFTFLSSDYRWQHEIILFGWLPNGKRRWYGDRKETTVWNVKRPTRSPFHPTMKPVALIERALINSSAVGDIVLDMFGGSGSVILACEGKQRKARMMEIDPKYVAAALERWSALTGRVPSRAS